MADILIACDVDADYVSGSDELTREFIQNISSLST